MYYIEARYYVFAEDMTERENDWCRFVLDVYGNFEGIVNQKTAKLSKNMIFDTDTKWFETIEEAKNYFSTYWDNGRIARDCRNAADGMGGVIYTLRQDESDPEWGIELAICKYTCQVERA